VKIHKISNTGFQEMDLSFGASLAGGASDLSVLTITSDHSMTMGLRFKPQGEPLSWAGEVSHVELTLRGGMEIGALIDLMRLAIAVYEAESRGGKPMIEKVIHQKPTREYKCPSIYGGTIERDDDDIESLMSSSDFDFVPVACAACAARAQSEAQIQTRDGSVASR
jgi:hypothetical protein